MYKSSEVLVGHNIYTEEEVKIEFDKVEGAIADPYWYSISSDGRFGIIDLSYLGTTGFEPSVIDPYPDGKKGYYIYNFLDETLTYVGDASYILNWDKDSTSFYIISGYNYHEEADLSQGHYKVDVTSGEATLIKEIKNPFDVDYVEYYLDDVKIRETASFQSYGSYQITIYEDGEETEVENRAVERTISRNYHGEIYISPDHDYIIYPREYKESLIEFVLVDLESKEKRVILHPSDREYLGIVRWVNDNHFIVGVHSSEEGVSEGDLMLVNIHTGDTTILTNDGYSYITAGFELYN